MTERPISAVGQPPTHPLHTERPIVFRALAKIVAETETIDGRVLRSLYVTFRGRGFCLTWGLRRDLIGR